MRPPLDLDESGPVAEVTRRGRWTYDVLIRHGLMVCGPGGYPWHVFGRERAARKGRRELARYLAEQTAKRDTLVIRAATDA